MKYSEDVMYNAVIECDKNYDGKFFYVVQTVGVYCSPSCKSRTPLRENVLFFESTDEAKKAGYRACKRCHPDVIDYAPMGEVIKQTKALIDNYFNDKECLLEKMKKIGISSNHLTTVFRQHYKMTPQEYLSQRRLEYAKNLLTRDDWTIADIAEEVGFASLSSFYSFFRKHTKMTPKKYRVQEGAS